MLAYDSTNPPGRTEAGRTADRDGRPVFEAQMLELGAVALDGTAPTATVADQLLTFVFGNGDRAWPIEPSEQRRATAEDAVDDVEPQLVEQAAADALTDDLRPTWRRSDSRHQSTALDGCAFGCSNRVRR